MVGGVSGGTGFRSRLALRRRMLGVMADVTQILNAIEQGDPKAAAELLPLVYDELRKLAAARLAAEKPGQTLQPTALVHEAYLRHGGARARVELGDHLPATGPDADQLLAVDEALGRLAADDPTAAELVKLRYY